MHDLTTYREAIELLDDELIDVLTRRAVLVRALWAHKSLEGLPREDRVREHAEIARLLDRAEARGLDRDRVEAVLGTVIGHDLLALPLTSGDPPPGPSHLR